VIDGIKSVLINLIMLAASRARKRPIYRREFGREAVRGCHIVRRNARVPSRL